MAHFDISALNKKNEDLDALEKEEYFHGFLAKEDVKEMLDKPGEFLLRTTDFDRNHRRYVISVKKFQKENIIEPDDIQHFLIQEDKQRSGTKYRIENKAFSTIQGLIEYYQNTGKSLVKNDPGVLLVQGAYHQPWEISHDDITTLNKIGEGTFGEVFFGYIRVSGKKRRPCVIKIGKVTGNNATKCVSEIIKEARIMRHFDHPNIVRMFGFAVEKEPISIIMEFVDGGSLEKILRSTKVEAREKEKMCCDAAWGLEYLHSRNFVHRDIAARNCLYSKHKLLKLADFGLSRSGNAYQLKNPTRLPVRWLAPETVKKGEHTQKSDVYSFGVLLWEIFSDGAIPYADASIQNVGNLITAGEKLEFPEKAPKKIAKLAVKHCWNENAVERYSMQKVAIKLETVTRILPPSFQIQLRSVSPDNEYVKHGNKEDKKCSKNEIVDEAQISKNEPVENKKNSKQGTNEEKKLSKEEIKKSDGNEIRASKEEVKKPEEKKLDEIKNSDEKKTGIDDAKLCGKCSKEDVKKEANKKAMKEKVEEKKQTEEAKNSEKKHTPESRHSKEEIKKPEHKIKKKTQEGEEDRKLSREVVDKPEKESDTKHSKESDPNRTHQGVVENNDKESKPVVEVSKKKKTMRKKDTKNSVQIVPENLSKEKI